MTDMAIVTDCHIRQSDTECRIRQPRTATSVSPRTAIYVRHNYNHWNYNTMIYNHSRVTGNYNPHYVSLARRYTGRGMTGICPGQ
jgi:hypothetical protein